MSDSNIALEERVRGLRGTDPVGDWLDVRRRARRAGRRTLALVAVAALLIAVPTVALGGRLLDVFGITATDERVPTYPGTQPVPHVHGDVLYGLTRTPLRLAEPLLPPLLGPGEPPAVPSPGWRDVVYHAWDGQIGGDGTPVLRRVDTRTGRDVEFARGAQSIAIGGDGRVAYMQATHPRYENSAEGTLGGRVGHVLVASSLDDEAERWTEHEGEYVVLAWARDTLLVESLPGPGYHPPPGNEPPPGVYALTGRGSLRALPIRGVVAVSPDGRRVLGWWAEGDSGSRGTRLVDVASGAVVATSPLKLQRRGDWHGERVVVSVGGNAQQLAVVRVRGDAIARERVLALAEDPALRATYGPFIGSPVFTDDGRTVIMRVASVMARGATIEEPRFVGFLTCKLTARACVRGRNLLPPTTWGEIVYNASRPAAVDAPSVSAGAGSSDGTSGDE